MGEQVGHTAAPTHAADPSRLQAVTRSAMTMSWLWLVPLALICAAEAYPSLVFTSFVSEAMGGEATVGDDLISVTLIGVVLFAAAGAGLAATWILARWVGRLSLLERAHPWLLGSGSATVGAVVAAATFSVSHIVWSV